MIKKLTFISIYLFLVQGGLSQEYKTYYSIDEALESSTYEQVKALDLSGCTDLYFNTDCQKLEKIDPRLSNFKWLISLNLRNNELSDLPSFFTEFENLEVLNLRSNQFTKIPTVLTQIPSLTELNISENPILESESLPGLFNNLERFSVDQLSTSGICNKLSSLKSLYLGASELPKCIINLKQLEELSFYGETEMPLEELLNSMPKLQILKCRSEIKSPEVISSLPYLLDQEKTYESIKESLASSEIVYKLDLSFSDYSADELRSLKEHNYLTSITFGDIGLAGLSTIPKEILELENLKSINLGGVSKQAETKLILLQLSEMPALENLTISHMHGLEADWPKSGFDKLKFLNLSHNNLKEIPKNIFKIKSLERLDLSANQLLGLPKNFGDLSNLNTLDLSSFPEKNNILNLPPSFSLLTNLESLDIKEVGLTELPKNFGKLKKLKTLYLSGNELHDLPKSFGALVSLKELYLGGNNFQQISQSIYDLRDLEILYLPSNNIKQVDKKISQLSNLKELSVIDNPGIKLPEEIKSLRKLESFYYD